MKKVLFFDSMLTPKIITIVYWILLVAAVISGIAAMFNGYGGFTIVSLVTGICIAIASAVGARIWCELMIVLFKIHENLQKLVDKSDA
ncbi:DUF4282 domain-containing protein [Shewanella olleyana]|uniref:DUF4282 domain-containing protein n=1 Tax=Shewanella olleyana TaxID=135626 RepID=UPI00200E028C|nr:DUF4282 domain-containing protein [Shewanella olleyana]MCL1065754.1 DUF4282 domain-containing protein [Shewanella olleyana]